MTYQPGAIVTYGGQRLSPAPQISFNTELVYANDTIAGYSYIVSLSGYATAIDRLANDTTSYGLTDVSSAIEKIRDIFSYNGENLLVKDKDNQTIMECRGGTVKSITFEESSNNWVNYSPYKIEIEFSEILISGCSVSNSLTCTSLSIDGNGTAPNLIDLTKYKIRSFNDNWSFNISEAAYNNYDIFQNQYINIEYTVSATGKNFYNDQKKLLPAWEQAKNFVQDRVYDQVKGLIGNILNRNISGDGCTASKTLSQLHNIGSPGGIDGISSSTHKIYNETISCEAGEAEGTFSATYKAILKYNNAGGNPMATDCIHTISKSKNFQQDSKSKNVSISVQGSISGLIPGGLINTPNIIEFPKTGKIFITYNNNETKYSKALSAFNSVTAGDDISDGMKTILNITGSELLASCSNSPKVSSFSTTHDYTAGIISYSAEYNSNRACGHDRSYRNISLTIEDSVPKTVEFVVPGRADGPIIQRIGVNSATRINVNIEGVSDSLVCCPDLSTQVSNICTNGLILPNDLPPLEMAGMKLESNQATVNPLDGSYVISRSYIKYDI